MDLVISLPLLLLAIVVHEVWGHKLFAETLTSLKPTFIAIGIPILKKKPQRTIKIWFVEITIPEINIDTVWKKIERPNRTPVVLSWLMVGGGVGFDDKEYYSMGKVFEKLVMITAGPMVNIALALILVTVFFDLETAVVVLKSYWLVSVDLLLALFTTSTVIEAINSHRFYEVTLSLAERSVWWQFVAYAALWNISLAVTNLLPIPGLDGGQIVSTILINLFGERIVPIVKQINTVSAYVLIVISTIAMIWWVVSSLIGYLNTLG